MKISSKSILSPGRTGVRNPPTSLTTSHSRRLRTSGSVRGGASPATFTTTAKKRGNFENPEPSSPKVTCIGQVRVRSRRKQAKRLRNLSRRRGAGEGSFGKLDHPLNGFPSKRHKHKESLNLGSKGSQNGQQNQECSAAQKKWAHFPVTICDSLKAFGSEFSCLFPCRGKEEKTVAAQGGDRQGSCGEEFARWLVAVQDGDEEQEEESVRKSRRHVFEDLQIVDDRIEGHKDEGRVSVCVPPKNALLLMRGRSEPIKIEAFTSRSWEPSVERTDEGDEVVENEDLIEEDLEMPQENLEVGQRQVMILDQDQENAQQDEGNQEHVQDEANQDQEHVRQDEVGQDQEQDNVQHYEVGEKQVVILDQENVQQDEANQEQDNAQQDEANQYQENDILQQDEADQDQEHENMQLYEVGEGQEHNPTEELEESFYLVSLFEEIVNQDYEIQEYDETHEEVVNEAEDHKNGVLERESEVKEERESEEVLPECLLMMMYEPKLSMEVSKETWVCRTDFIQRQSRIPPAPATVPAKPDGGDESSVNATATVNEVYKVAGGGFPTALPQPARSSCTLPAAPSMAMVVEQKLAKAVGYEPFVLTRCKSEPMKTAASKLQPESCVLENRKLERLSRVAFSVGAAGLGF